MNHFPDYGTEQAETRGIVNNKQLCYSLVVREGGNSRRQVSWATEFCSFSVGNLMFVTLLAPELLRRLLHFGRRVHPCSSVCGHRLVSYHRQQVHGTSE
jgi:ABC-type Fe3+-siderophore transport system permease subunit